MRSYFSGAFWIHVTFTACSLVLPKWGWKKWVSLSRHSYTAGKQEDTTHKRKVPSFVLTIIEEFLRTVKLHSFYINYCSWGEKSATNNFPRIQFLCLEIKQLNCKAGFTFFFLSIRLSCCSKRVMVTQWAKKKEKQMDYPGFSKWKHFSVKSNRQKHLIKQKKD